LANIARGRRPRGDIFERLWGKNRYLPKILKSSISEQRRSRVNVSGVVTPSPVGVAIENDK
jgi:hypothetical protein